MNVYDDSRDSLQYYLQEIASSQPLDAKEEVALASRIKKGDESARAKLVEANLRFVISIAKKYQNRGVPLADLISAGNIGLITAADRFDETKGFKFISYAVWWIRQAIQLTLAEYSRVVRLPVNRLDLLRRISQYVSSQEKESAYNPSEEEIAEALGVSVEQVVDTIIKGRHIRSLDAALGDDEKNSLLDIIQDECQESPDVLFMQNALKEHLDIALSSLDEREREVLRLYFGLDGSPGMTLEEIGTKFGLTRERIRQIKEKALSRLRNPARARKLMPYAEEI